VFVEAAVAIMRSNYASMQMLYPDISLCKNIVERHGGSIQAGGAKDRGASFTIMLSVKQL